MQLEAVKGREVRTARKSAIPTQKMAGLILNMGETKYNHLEQSQEDFTIRQLKTLYKALGTDGKDTLAAWVQNEFSGETLQDAKETSELAIR